MARVSLTRHEAVKGDLPLVCMRCGEGAPRIYRTRMVFGRQRFWLRTPLCDAHKHHWLWRSLMIPAGCATALILWFLMVFASVLFRDAGVRVSGNVLAIVVLGLAGIALIDGMVIFVILQLRGIHVIAADKAMVSLDGVAPEFIEALRVYRFEKGLETGKRVPADGPASVSENPPAREMTLAEWAAGNGPLADELRTVFDLAVKASRRRGHDHVGTAHLLLGIAGAVPSVSASVLKSLGVDGSQIEAEIYKNSEPPHDVPFGGNFPITPSVRRALTHAVQEARPTHLTTEHVLLALLHDQESEAAQILTSLAVDFEKVQKVVSNRHSGTGEPTSSSSTSSLGSIQPMK